MYPLSDSSKCFPKTVFAKMLHHVPILPRGMQTTGSLAIWAMKHGREVSRGEHSFSSSSSSYFLVINYHCFLWHRDFPSPYSFQSYQQNMGMGPCGSPSSAQFWPKCAECCLWLELVWCRWWWWYFDAGLYMAAISNSIHDGQIQPPALINNVNH